MENLDSLVNSVKLPKQLKEYFTVSKDIKNFLTPKLINEIEEVYVYYSALYSFDSTEFSAHTVRTLKNCKTSDSIKLQLQEILDTSLELKSRDENSFKKIKINITENPLIDKAFMDIALKFIKFSEQNYNKQEIEAKELYKFVGKLEIINDLVKDNFYRKLLHDTKFIIHSKSIV